LHRDVDSGVVEDDGWPMVSWWWLVVAFAGGNVLALLVAGLAVMAGRMAVPVPSPTGLVVDTERLRLIPRPGQAIVLTAEPATMAAATTVAAAPAAPSA
jgi:hypothetical protein